MKLLAFHRATSLEDACAALAHPKARCLAGGTDLIVQVREGRRDVETMVDVKAVPEMTAVTQSDDSGLHIGAAIPAARLARDDRLVRDYPALVTSLGMIGSRQIQNRATLGGNICNASPSADAIPPLIAYDAVAVVGDGQGTRRLPLSDLFEAPGRTSLAPNEVLIGVDLPRQPEQSAASYMRFTPRREMDIAVVGVAAWIWLDEDKTIKDARIALASVAPTPIRSPAAETALIGQRPTAQTFEGAAEAAADDASPISDTRASADYRRELVRALTRRTLAASATSLLSEQQP